MSTATRQIMWKTTHVFGFDIDQAGFVSGNKGSIGDELQGLLITSEEGNSLGGIGGPPLRGELTFYQVQHNPLSLAAGNISLPLFPCPDANPQRCKDDYRNQTNDGHGNQQFHEGKPLAVFRGCEPGLNYTYPPPPDLQG